MLVAIERFSMRMCGQVWFCACEPWRRREVVAAVSQLWHQSRLTAALTPGFRGQSLLTHSSAPRSLKVLNLGSTLFVCILLLMWKSDCKGAYSVYRLHILCGFALLRFQSVVIGTTLTVCLGVPFNICHEEQNSRIVILVFALMRLEETIYLAALHELQLIIIHVYFAMHIGFLKPIQIHLVI